MIDICKHCGEEVTGKAIPVTGFDPYEGVVHSECFIRMIAGSVGHQTELCECHGVVDVSEQGITKHEAARQAAKVFIQRRRENYLKYAKN